MGFCKAMKVIISSSSIFECMRSDSHRGLIFWGTGIFDHFFLSGVHTIQDAHCHGCTYYGVPFLVWGAYNLLMPEILKRYTFSVRLFFYLPGKIYCYVKIELSKKIDALKENKLFETAQLHSLCA